MIRRHLTVFGLLALVACSATSESGEFASWRFATFNTSLFRPSDGELAADLAAGDDQARRIAAIIQRVRPSVVLLQEFDFDPTGEALRRFQDDYLGLSQFGSPSIEYQFVYTAPVNTGEPTGLDLDHDGKADGPGDAYGFGSHRGQYGMVLLSQLPILEDRIRTFRLLPWRDVPDSELPMDYYGSAASAALRLSSKSHWDVPVRLPDGRILHVLASHPTPPVFDGEEDRNGRRNHDEIRLWADYTMPGRGLWIVDDAGVRGGIDQGEPFIVVGDLNADPFDGDARTGSIEQLLEHPRIDAWRAPASQGAVESAERAGGQNLEHRGDPEFDTAEFDPERTGNLRLDYVLPSTELELLAGGVFWPVIGDADHELIEASDHRMVWIDVR